MPELLLRPDLGKRAYKLHCRFRMDAYPSESWLDKAKYAAAEQFVKDMAKQGWQYVEKHGFKMTGPYVSVSPVTLPRRSQQKQWHIPSRDMLAALQAGYRFRANGGNYVQEVPSLTATEKWEFDLAGVFVHKTILIEVPDIHEEREVLKHG